MVGELGRAYNVTKVKCFIQVELMTPKNFDSNLLKTDELCIRVYAIHILFIYIGLHRP